MTALNAATVDLRLGLLRTSEQAFDLLRREPRLLQLAPRADAVEVLLLLFELGGPQSLPSRCLDGVAGLAGEVCTVQGALNCTQPTSQKTSFKIAPRLHGSDGTGTTSPVQFRAP